MRRQRAAEVAALVSGFRSKKPNLVRIVRQLSGEDPERAHLEDLQDVLEESNARVDPKARAEQLEKKRLLEASEVA